MSRYQCAMDVVTVDHFVQYNAVHYIAGQRLRMTERVSLSDIDNELSCRTADVCVLVEQIEIYLNAFWNTCRGVVLFGITGRIAGQEGKRHYLEYTVLHRVEQPLFN
eukprot:132499_1